MWHRLTLVSVAVALASAAPVRAQEAPVPGPCQQSVLGTGARTKICFPTSGWNGQLVVFVHGYVPDVPDFPGFPSFPLDFYDVLPGVGDLGLLAQQQGFAYATTSYRRNGLVILDGIQDVQDLLDEYAASGLPTPLRTYLAGASEGALVATLTVERLPGLFRGAYATCGPIGSFRTEINYLGDFRVLFDYFFPDVFKGNATSAHPDDVFAWRTGVGPAVVTQRLLSAPARAVELMRTARTPFDPARFSSVIEATVRLLQYTVLGANDLTQELGGNAFENRFRFYFGSSNDLLLNLRVDRFHADAEALAAVRAHETSGALRVPLVTLHTTGDEVAPFAQELFYLLKARPSGRGRFIPLPVVRNGHCNFTANEVLTGLGLLVLQP